MCVCVRAIRDHRYIQETVRAESIDEKEVFPTHVGIGHTRWATHGPPCQRNRYCSVGVVVHRRRQRVSLIARSVLVVCPGG